MNKEEMLLLDILKCAIHNESIDSLDITLEESTHILQLSQIHHIAPLIYDKIYMYIPHQIQPVWKSNISKQTIFQVIKTNNFIKLYQDMLTNGFIPLVFKGIICRNIYPKPDLRISSDEDLLIQKKDQKRMDEYLINQGFIRDIDYDDSKDEIGYHHPKLNLYLEIHTLLFSKNSPYAFLNDYFQTVFENKITITIQNQLFYTFDYTQHLIYLLAHSYKHFVHGGFGLRQVCDMVMYMHTYGAFINYDEVDAYMEKYKLDCFWSNLLDIARSYLGFDEDQAHYHIHNKHLDSYDLLMDILQSGIYGASTFERKHSSNMTLEAIGSQHTSTFKSIMKSLFPQKSYIQTNYSYTKKYPLLLPIGYIHRILSYI
ncbi:MAG: nucleotidyltransferase family protein, partial [Erysipelotrichaceae bacterium]|nr:nucleotidyltransferase family protein [Erysipelotrichaceae bacterium]